MLLNRLLKELQHALSTGVEGVEDAISSKKTKRKGTSAKGKPSKSLLDDIVNELEIAIGLKKKATSKRGKATKRGSVAKIKKTVKTGASNAIKKVKKATKTSGAKSKKRKLT